MLHCVAPPTATVQPVDSKKDNKIIYIAGGAGGGALVIVTLTIIVIITVIYYRKKKSTDFKPLLQFAEDSDDENVDEEI